MLCYTLLRIDSLELSKIREGVSGFLERVAAHMRVVLTHRDRIVANKRHDRGIRNARLFKQGYARVAQAVKAQPLLTIDPNTASFVRRLTVRYFGSQTRFCEKIRKPIAKVTALSLRGDDGVCARMQGRAGIITRGERFDRAGQRRGEGNDQPLPGLPSDQSQLVPLQVQIGPRQKCYV